MTYQINSFGFISLYPEYIEFRSKSFEKERVLRDVYLVYPDVGIRNSNPVTSNLFS